jgi:hypothetical protein
MLDFFVLRACSPTVSRLTKSPLAIPSDGGAAAAAARARRRRAAAAAAAAARLRWLSAAAERSVATMRRRRPTSQSHLGAGPVHTPPTGNMSQCRLPRLLACLVAASSSSPGGGGGAAALDANCSCTSFCQGTCAASNAGRPVKQMVYRLTPYNVTGLAEKDTGDAPGDMGFYFERFRAMMTCTPELANTNACFLGVQPVVRRFLVEMDGKWGPFMRCNPLPFYNPTDSVHVDTKNWGCFPWHGYPPTPWIQPDEGSDSCLDHAYCPEIMNRSVGRDPAQHHSYDPAHPNLGTYFGGEWYSTKAMGECGPGRVPGDGKRPSCSWRLSPSGGGTEQVVKTINATCMDSHLLPLVEANGKPCFDTLPQPLNRTSSGYVECLEAAIMVCGCPFSLTCISTSP